MEEKDALERVASEVERASKLFPPFRSPHEGLAIILEEYEELKSEVFKQFSERTKFGMRVEAKHVAAMAIRFMRDLT